MKRNEHFFDCIECGYSSQDEKLKNIKLKADSDNLEVSYVMCPKCNNIKIIQALDAKAKELKAKGDLKYKSVSYKLKKRYANLIEDTVWKNL